MLYAGLEQLDTIDDDVVESVAADMTADAPARDPQIHEARVLPLRGATIAPAGLDAEVRSELEGMLEQRVAALEARLEARMTVDLRATLEALRAF